MLVESNVGAVAPAWPPATLARERVGLEVFCSALDRQIGPILVAVLYAFSAVFAVTGVFALYAWFTGYGASDPARSQPLALAVVGCAFAAVGLGVAAASRLGAARVAAARVLRDTFPDQPWRWRVDWAEGRAASNSRGALSSSWAIAGLWTIVSAPLLLIVPNELACQPLAALGFLFPLLGVVLIGHALLRTLRWRRFGPAWIALAPLPASPGGTVSGTLWTGRLSLARDAAVPPSVTLRLSCLRRTINRSGEDTNTREDILWRDEATVAAHTLTVGPSGTGIPVYFDLPADALETTTYDQSAGVFWSLTAEATLPGVDLKEEFDVPVYRTSSVVGGSAVRSTAPTAAPQPVTLDELAASGIRVERRADGTAYALGAARNVSFAAGTTAFLGVWTGALMLQYRLGFPWVFLILTALVEIVLIAMVLGLWIGTRRLEIRRDVVWTRGQVLGIGATRTVPSSDVRSIDLHIGMQTSGRWGTPYYDVRARLANGRRLTLLTAIRQKRHAEWLAADIGRAVRLVSIADRHHPRPSSPR